MPVYDLSYTLPPLYQVGSALNVGGDSSARNSLRKMFGKDKRVALSDGLPVRQKTTNGDYATTSGVDALRQWVILCIITTPGEWATLPEFGCGARQYVKAKSTRANREELEQRIKTQLLKNKNIEAVAVSVQQKGESLTIAVYVTPRARGGSQFGIALEVS